MKKKHRNQKPGASKGKLALIAVLGVMLLAVWGNALVGGDSQPAEASRRTRKPASRHPSVAPVAAKPAAASPTINPVQWPTMPLAQAVRNDPFGKPGWAISPRGSAEAGAKPAQGAAVAGAIASQQQLTETGASMIVIAGDERIATIGDQEVRIGDRVSGYEVVDITPAGVVLAKDAARN